MTAVPAEPCIECGHNPRAGSGRLSRCLVCIKAAAQRDREAREQRRAGSSGDQQQRPSASWREGQLSRKVTNPGSWPRLMRAEKAAAYVDERSVEAFRRAVGTLYPAPLNVPGKGDRWLKDALDEAIDRI